MSNHLHVILHGRLDGVAAWSDDDVARRWWMIFPQRRDDQGSRAKPTDADLAMLQLPKRQRWNAQHEPGGDAAPLAR